jgi:hypothetical protein
LRKIKKLLDSAVFARAQEYSKILSEAQHKKMNTKVRGTSLDMKKKRGRRQVIVREITKSFCQLLSRQPVRASHRVLARYAKSFILQQTHMSRLGLAVD